jgi:hypothetical protein
LIKRFYKISFDVDNGLSNGYLGKQLARNADLSEGLMNRILENCPDIDTNWVLTGKGEMLIKMLIMMY